MSSDDLAYLSFLYYVVGNEPYPWLLKGGYTVLVYDAVRIRKSPSTQELDRARVLVAPSSHVHV